MEAAMRTDYDRCKEHFMTQYDITEDIIKNISDCINAINLYGWHIDCEDL